MTSTSNEIMIKADRLGNASASDVVSGKTFTSENGLKITGTGSSGISYSSTYCMYSSEPDASNASWSDMSYDPVRVNPDPGHSMSDIVAIAVYIRGFVKLFSTTIDTTDGPTGGMTITDGSKTIEPEGVAVIQRSGGWGVLTNDIHVSTDWDQSGITIYLEASQYEYVGQDYANGGSKLYVIALYK